MSTPSLPSTVKIPLWSPALAAAASALAASSAVLKDCWALAIVAIAKTRIAAVEEASQAT
jgi:hypothetical protein